MFSGADMVSRVAAYVRRQKLLQAGDRVSAAVSGGADSVALLLALLDLRCELGIALSVTHFHHGIRGKEADGDARFVDALAQEHGLDLVSGAGDAPETARKRGLSLETAARELRYEFFRELMSTGSLDKVATAHTQDDQAETVLMRFIRGAGTRGMAGIHPAKGEGRGRIVRPLLEITRGEIEAFLKQRSQAWREDSTNKDNAHTRNKVRHELLPRLRSFNPAIVETLARTAEVARAEEEYWQRETERLLPMVLLPGKAARGGGRAVSNHSGAQNFGLDIDNLSRQPLAIQRRIIRSTAETAGIGLDVSHVESALAVACGEIKSCELPGGWQVERSHRELRFRRKAPAAGVAGYEYPVPIPGHVPISDVNLLVHLHLMPVDEQTPAYNLPASNRHAARAVLSGEAGKLTPLAQATELRLRNWREGDRFRQANGRSEKKVNELLQELKVPREKRSGWPVMSAGSKLIWVRGTRALPLWLADEQGRVQRLVIEVQEAGQK